jgi:hypothetical protein
MSPVEITVFEKTNGPLTKRITLRDGKIVNDSSGCFMADGTARRVSIASMQDLADLINGLKPNEAYALGRLKDELPDCCKVVRKDKLNGSEDLSVIARSLDFLGFNEGQPGLALLDYDTKGMSEAVASRLEECGGVWGALCEVLPALETVACVERASTSSGLRNRETGESFPGSGGLHIVIPVVDAADIQRFSSDLHDRCWLAGLGWGMVSAAGSFLERAIIDKSVASPERLIFEGAPIIAPPLEQTGRDAKVHDGSVLDTQSLFPPLTDSERSRARELKAAEELRLLPQRQEARAKWSTSHIKNLVSRGVPESEARATVDRWIDRKELTGTFPLPFDAWPLAWTTVADVLASPDRYINKTLSDPFEGPDYGRGKAIPYQRPDGSLFVNSFAHGGIIYELKAPQETEGLGEWDAGEDVTPPKPRGWLVGNSFARTFISSVIAEGGGGKTALRYAQYLSGATGRELTGEHVFQRIRVLIVSLEDDKEEVKRRVLAGRLHHGIDASEVRGYLFLSAPGASAGKLMTVDRKGRVVRGTLADALEAAIIRHKIDLVALDPFVKSHGVSENDNKMIDEVVQILSDLATKHNVAVDIPHHVRKGAADPGNADRWRGASSAKDAGRLVSSLTPMTNEEAVAFGVSDEERRFLIRLDNAKVNIAPPSSKAKWFRLVSVNLGNATDLYPNGDDVQTVERWHPPETWEGLDTAILNTVLNTIDRGIEGERYSDDNAAKTRAAWKAVQQHAAGKTEAQCREIIRQWIKNGVLVRGTYTSAKDRKERTGLTVVHAKRPGTEL